MMETLHLRLSLSEHALLQAYLDGKPPDFEAVRFQLRVSERQLDWRKPDHFHQLSQSHNLEGIQSISDLFLKGLPDLAAKFLYCTDSRFYVKHDRFEAWQKLILRMSPLVLMACAVFKKYGAPKPSRGEILSYVERRLHWQVGTSALPTVREPAIEELIEQEGLADLHVHLNGSTEMDTVWLQSLLERRQFLKELNNSFRKQGHAVRQLYQQIEPGLNPVIIGERLRVARRLRIALWARLFLRKWPSEFSRLTSLADLNQLSLLQYDGEQRLDLHPVREAFGLPESVSEMECEVLWLISAFNELQRCPSEDFAGALHCYLLIQGATFIPLCVHQLEQFGFDQFQKITLSGVREPAEQQYLARFRQAAYRDERSDLRLLEGRFAPKEKVADNAALLVRTLTGFTRFHESRRKEVLVTEHLRYPLADVLVNTEPIVLEDRLDFRLVAHFIKKDELTEFIKKCKPTESEPLDLCRFYNLRCSLRRQARSLVFLRESFPRLRHYLTGIDAAANELHTPPEAFAPIFRYARRNGLRRATFHVGEDYHHLLSGIRAIWEAVDFLELRSGDRIGHGVAIGIDPLVWSKAMPLLMPMRQGEWLDNLVFTRRLLLEYPEATVLIPKIEEEILRLA